MILSSGQTDAVDAIMRWYKSDEKRFVLAGYAGAGKTTLAKHVASLIGENDVIFCAFTGKAANVLRDKGCANVYGHNQSAGILYACRCAIGASILTDKCHTS